MRIQLQKMLVADEDGLKGNAVVAGFIWRN